MKATVIFARCRSFEADVRAIRQRIQQRREAIACITPHMDANGGSHGTVENDRLASFAGSVDALEREMLAREQARYVELAAASVLLDSMPETESTVLHGYYIRRQKISAIAKKLGYTEGYVRKLKSEGDKLLDAIGESEVQRAVPAWYLREWPEGKKRGIN